MLQQRFHNMQWKFGRRLQIALHQRIPGKLRERCHNVERRKLWKCCLLTLLQRNPGTLLKCWATVVKMFPPDVASTSYSKVAKTLSQRWGKVVKTLAHEVAATYSRKVSRLLPQNVVWKHLHNIMETFIDNIEVLWYSQCCGNISAIWENPLRKYQDIFRKNWRRKRWCPHHFTGWFYVPLPLNKCP